MFHVLALGVAIPWARSGPADFTPVLAVILAAVVIRFVLGFRLTLLPVSLAVLSGTLWAAATPHWGVTLPTLAALAGVGVLSVVRRRAV